MKTIIAGSLLILLCACQAPIKPKTDAAVAQPVSATQPTGETPTEPVLSPAEAKRQAQALALQAASLLDEGREAEARELLTRARSLDERNEVAAKLLFSLDADPEKELGARHFRYTVRPGDTLSKIAEQFLGDQYRFYLLARYNALAVPRALMADQVVKVPGTRPASPSTAPAEESPKPDKAGKETKATARSPSAQWLQECKSLWAAGDAERAIMRCEEANAASPREPEAPAILAQYRKEWSQAQERRAREAYRRQDLAGCIAAWNRVLQVNPGHDSAARERDRCQRLKTELEKSAN